MLSPSLSAKNMILFLIVLLPLLAGCGPSASGGITIVQNDNTAPTLSLGVGQPGGQDVTVNADEPRQHMKITSKTGVLNLLATANDPESGVQALEIWISIKSTHCTSDALCSVTGPGLSGSPTFESTEPQKMPGETTAASSIMAQSLDLSKFISQGNLPAGESITIELNIDAVAVNHLGGRTQFASIIATWREP